jgi:hypothetical protein
MGRAELDRESRPPASSLVPLPFKVSRKWSTRGDRGLDLLASGCLVEASSGVLEISSSLRPGGFAVVYFLGWGAMITGIALMMMGLRELRPLARRRRGSPWRLLQIVAAAGLAVCEWLGRHVRRVRRRYYVAWAITSLAAIGLLTVATIEVERIDARRRARPYPWRGFALWGGGALATLALLVLIGNPDPIAGPTCPLWMAAGAGGIVVLAFGLWFLALVETLRPRTARWAGWLAPAALGWAIGVSILGGWVLGPRALAILVDLFTNAAALGPVVGPFVESIAPLFVGYLLVAVAVMAARRLPHADAIVGAAPSDPSIAG